MTSMQGSSRNSMRSTCTGKKRKSVKILRKDTQLNKNVPNGLFRNADKVKKTSRNTALKQNASRYLEKYVAQEINKFQAEKSALIS